MGALCHLQLLSVSSVNISCMKCLSTAVLLETTVQQELFTPNEGALPSVYYEKPGRGRSHSS